MQKILRFTSDAVQSYPFIIAVALIAALAFPSNVVVLAPLATLFLQIIFFLTSLKLDPNELLHESKQGTTLIVVSLFMLLVLPAVTYLVASALVPSLAVALLLLAAMPTGMTAPLLAEVVGGKVSTALVLTITTSLLAPFTVPIVVGTFAGSAVTVGVATMFWTLVQVILIPFVLAQIVRRFAHAWLEKTYATYKPISLVLLGLLIAGVTAKQADVIMNGFAGTILFQLAILTSFIALLLVVGYIVAFWRAKEERLTVAVTTTFMNFTLAILLGSLFFSDPSVALAAVLIIFPWSLMIVPLKWVVDRSRR